MVLSSVHGFSIEFFVSDLLVGFFYHLGYTSFLDLHIVFLSILLSTVRHTHNTRPPAPSALWFESEVDSHHKTRFVKVYIIECHPGARFYDRWDW